jgi:hypothetical protein
MALDDILGGLNPYAGQQLAAALAAGVGADPSRLGTSDLYNPMGQVFGQINAGIARNQAAGLAQQLAGERMTALPDLASAYSADDPFKWAAANPNASPLARAMILGGSPGEVAKAKEAGAAAALANLNVRGFPQPGTPLSTGGLGAGAVAPIGAPANRRVAVQQPGAGPAPLRDPGGGAVNPYYPGGGASGAAGGAGADAGAGAGLDAMSGAQLQQYAKGQLTPAQRYQLARAYMRRQAAGGPGIPGAAAATAAPGAS